VLKRWFYSAYYINKDSIKVPIDVYWKVESIESGFDYGFDDFLSDTIAVNYQDVDLVRISVSRNNISWYFYIKLIDKIQYGIYPNPATIFVDNGQKYPKIYITDQGDITDIEVAIYDLQGNLITKLSGIGNNGDFEDITDYSNQSDTTAATNIIREFISDKWDGTNTNGILINSGVYILHFYVYFRTEDAKIEKKEVSTKFYFVRP
jgi:hypothetical protein